MTLNDHHGRPRYAGPGRVPIDAHADAHADVPAEVPIGQPGGQPGGPPDAADLVVAVAEALGRLRSDPDAIRRQARGQRVSVEVVEAALIVSAVADWLARHPLPAAAIDAARLSQTVEGTRAVHAMTADDAPVAIAVRVPAMLAIRLVELAGATGTTVEAAAVGLLGDGADAAYADVCRRLARPRPRPWKGGQ